LATVTGDFVSVSGCGGHYDTVCWLATPCEMCWATWGTFSSSPVVL